MNEYGEGISREDALLDVGIGWAKLINKLYDALPEDTRVVQVKEKWGGLRFYTYNSTQEFDDLVDECETDSEHICEFCGQPGKLRNKLGWIKTLCDSCYADEQEYQKMGHHS